MSLGERIKEARAAKGLTQEQVGKHFGISREAVQQWETGDTAPKGGRLQSLAKLLERDVNWLVTGPASHTTATISRDNAYPHNGSRMLIIDELDVRAGMSLGGAIHETEQTSGIEMVKARWQIPAVVIRPYSSAPQEAIKIITAVGDSNIPEFFPGDRVMVDTQDRIPSPAGFFAIWDGFGEIIKRLEMVPYSDPPKVKLHSANEAYETRELPLDMVVINGRVLGKWKWT